MGGCLITQSDESMEVDITIATIWDMQQCADGLNLEILVLFCFVNCYQLVRLAGTVGSCSFLPKNVLLY